MDFKEYTWIASTFRPFELGEIELKILMQFAENNSSYSVYQIFRGFKQDSEIEGQFLHNTSNPNSLHSVREQLLKRFEGNEEVIAKINYYYFNSRAPIDPASQIVRKPTRGPASYKNTHKRVKRLAQLKLIEEIRGHFKRGAKHYKISTYGLITYMNKIMTESEEYILNNKKHLVMKSLLLQFFQEDTIDSFYRLKEFPTMDIRDYLRDCCSITTSICKEFWTQIKQYQIDDILPRDEIIQRYMSYLDGKSVDQHVLNEIKEYEARLLKKLDTHNNTDNNNEFEKKRLAAAVYDYERRYFRERKRLHYVPPHIRNYAKDRPPFPLLEIYYNIVWKLAWTLEIKIKSLAYDLVSQLGEIVNSERVKTREELEEEILEGNRDYSLHHILKDKKFFDLARSIKSNFDVGYNQFLYYHK